LNQQYGLTTVIVSHDTGIARHVDRVVAIRDGKTASETVRQAGADATRLEVAPTFDEVVLLDAAGRLQVPQEYLEQFNIRGRARLEPVENGILIRPVDNPGPDERFSPPVESASPESAPAESLRGWWKRLRGGREAR